MTDRRMELLAPAGDFDALRADGALILLIPEHRGIIVLDRRGFHVKPHQRRGADKDQKDNNNLNGSDRLLDRFLFQMNHLPNC